MHRYDYPIRLIDYGSVGTPLHAITNQGYAPGYGRVRLPLHGDIHIYVPDQLLISYKHLLLLDLELLNLKGNILLSDILATSGPL